MDPGTAFAAALKWVTIWKSPVNTESGFSEKLYFVHLAVSEKKAGGLERAGVPGKPQRDQIIVGRRVAVDVVAGAQIQWQRGINRGAGFRHHFARRRVVKDVALREGLRP